MRFRFGECVLDLERRQLERAGEAVHLSPKAFAVLEVLIAERPRPVSKRLLLDRVWSDVVVEDQNVKNTIVEIRAALGDDGGSIRTVHKFGYAFAGQAVEELPSNRARPHYWLYYGARSVPITMKLVEVGRDPNCELCIDLPGVSRRHARLTADGEEIRIEDLGSKNGTWVNGNRIDTAVALSDGSEIRVGSAVVVFRGQESESTLTEIK